MAARSPNKRIVGFDCEFLEPPPEKFIQSECPVCLLIIREPHQVTCCGKKFCKACIEHIKNTKKACPTCNEKKFSSYPDKGLKQSLYDLKVRCSHQGEGCQWTGELGQFDNHLNTDPPPEKQLEGCQYVKIACTNNCGDQLQRKYMTNHQHYHCSNRPFSCKHCRVYKTTYNDVTQTHWPVCGSFPLSCPNKCPSTIQRQNIDSHVANECPLTTINCDFHHVGCAVKLPRQDMPEHIKTSLHTHISLLATLVGKQQDKITSLEAENRELKANLKPSIKTVVPIGCSISLAPPILTMTNYQQHKRDNDSWYSPPLYTHPQGYKICLCVYVNGNGDAKGTHVSVFVYLKKGEFDNILKWPFRGIISYQLLDQANGTDHKTGTLTYDDRMSDPDIGGRVTEGERSPTGWGRPKFISHSALEPKYLLNNILLFQVYKVEIKEK